MPLLPIFMLGIIIGVLLSYSYHMYENNTPSKTKLEIQEYTINSQKNDIEMLTRLNEKLYQEINDLKRQLNIK